MEARQSDIYLGVKVTTPIKNQKRYEQAINMVLSFFEAHRD